MNNSNSMWGQFANIEEYYIDENGQIENNYTLKPINYNVVFSNRYLNNNKIFYYEDSYIVKIIKEVFKFVNCIGNL
jgi:hypothetical protein